MNTGTVRVQIKASFLAIHTGTIGVYNATIKAKFFNDEKLNGTDTIRVVFILLEIQIVSAGEKIIFLPTAKAATESIYQYTK